MYIVLHSISNVNSTPEIVCRPALSLPNRRGIQGQGAFCAKKAPIHTLFTDRIFLSGYPLCKGVIHVEIVENPVERVENYPLFPVEIVENPVDILLGSGFAAKVFHNGAVEAGTLLDKAPGCVYNKNNPKLCKGVTVV